MVVTLEWVRDNYDNNPKNRLIDFDEAIQSTKDFLNNIIDKEQLDAIQDAYNKQTLLPAYDTPTVITCNGATPHYPSGCALLLHYDVNKNGVVDISEGSAAYTDSRYGVITEEEHDFIYAAHIAGSINALCPGCYTATTPPPPNMETRTMSLTEGQHTIQVSFTGYDTLNATINVSSTGVTCISVIGGACGGSSLPRVSTSGWTVTTYLKSGAVTTDRCTWIATKDTSKVAFISEMVLAYNNLANIGFTPSASEISQAVLMYLNLGTPASLWGC